MKLTKEQIECNKREVIELLRSTKRDGIARYPDAWCKGSAFQS